MTLPGFSGHPGKLLDWSRPPRTGLDSGSRVSSGGDDDFRTSRCSRTASADRLPGSVSLVEDQFLLQG